MEKHMKSHLKKKDFNYSKITQRPIPFSLNSTDFYLDRYHIVGIVELHLI